jgi:outer membrane protein insertion porin family
VLYNSPVGRRVFCTLLLALLLLLGSSAAFSQSAGKAKLSYKLLAVKVRGLSHFREDQVIAASGLKLGQFAGEADFKQAIQKLGETGLFTNLTYTYQYSTAGCNVELQVAENDKLVPIVFDNFVWFSDEELFRVLHDRVRLFDGRLPVAGNLADQVADALNAVLSERKITGKAEYLRGAALEGPIDSYIYKVNFRAIVVRNMDFPGAAPAEMPALQAVAKQLSGQEYLRTKMRAQEKLNFVPVYLTRGYLEASFSDAQAKVAEDGAQTQVDVSFPVAAGHQYRLTGIAWAGNTVFTDGQLQDLVHLKNGEPANAIQLGDDLDQIHKLYGTKGYLFAHADPIPEMDDGQSTVHYQLSVTEGNLYRMGELQIDGLDADSAKKMAAQWQMKKGDPYDQSYMQKFFKIMYRDVGLRAPMNVVPKQSINQQDKTVSVSLHFVPKS